MSAFALDVVVKTTLVLLLGWAIARSLGGASAAVRHFVWAVALSVSVLLPVVAAFVPAWNIAILPARWVVAPVTEVSPALAVDTAGSAVASADDSPLAPEQHAPVAGRGIPAL